MKKQQGITLSGFIGFAIIICVMGLMAMKIVPVYINHYRVSHALKSLQSLPKSELGQSPVMVAQYLRSKVASQLYVNNIRTVKSKDIKISYKRNKYTLSLSYEVRKPFFANMTLLFDFKTKVEVTSGE